MSNLKSLLEYVAEGNSLSEDQAREAFSIIMSGEATPSQIGGFLMALRVRGETVEEITGAVAIMREKMATVSAPGNAIDIVGTGGDGAKTYNISTASAIVVAGAGVPVAKHGNRALSSKTGTADCLSVLGVNLDQPFEGITRCIEEAGIGFMFAPNHHAAMKHVGPSRVELGTRTIFNLLGPLSNPAKVKYHLIGVFAPEWIRPMVETLRNHGSKTAWVVHGAGGMDELSTLGPSVVAELKDGKIRQFEVTPEEVGLERTTIENLRGGEARENATALRAILDGEHNAYRDIVLLNSAASLLVAGAAPTLADGVSIAADSINSGNAARALSKLVDVSNG
ncbi:MAG: anthranilate phosphoribosyltransferase [Cohaesibacteraceae bacterium]|nr:anthranilate phosphoribosyltransferase [Cohaesibacteraceae bacterium]